MPGKRKSIHTVWNNFSDDFGKKLKIDKENNNSGLMNFRFGKKNLGRENQPEMNQSIEKVWDSKEWRTKSLDENKNSSLTPRFESRSSSISGFYNNNCSAFIGSKETNSFAFNDLRRASTTDWGKLVESAYLDQILDDIKAVEKERDDKKDYWNWEENFNPCQFTSL